MSEQTFLTGGSGFVGARFIKPLIAAGHRVRAPGRSEASANALLALGAEPHACPQVSSSLLPYNFNEGPGT